LLPKNLVGMLFNLEALMVLLSWITIVDMFVFPLVAATRGSKWWLVVSAAIVTSPVIAIVRFMRQLAFLIASLIVVPAGFACDFQYDPASVPTYYRAEGWSLPV
jgi:hypothetical protein